MRDPGNHNATFGVAGYLRNGGDSGAGVYWPTGFGFGAAGLHSRRISGPTPGVFSRFSVIASTWGLQMSPF